MLLDVLEYFLRKLIPEGSLLRPDPALTSPSSNGLLGSASSPRNTEHPSPEFCIAAVATVLIGTQRRGDVADVLNPLDGGS